MQITTATQVLEIAIPAHVSHESDVWNSWNADPQLLLPLALAAICYARGLSRWPERSRGHPWWRTTTFYLGLLLLVLTLESPLDAAAEHHLTFHMIQHELLVLIAPPLILIGAPTTPLLRGLPRVLRLSVVRPLARCNAVRIGWRSFTHPVFAWGFFTGTLWLWHLAPGWYEAALTDRWIHELQHFSFATAALLVWWNLIDPAPLSARLGYLPRILFLIAISIPKHLLGAFLTFASEPFYKTYEGRQLLDMSLATDQQIAGLLMWAPSQILMLGVIAIIFAVWYDKSGRGPANERSDNADPPAPLATPSGE